MEVKLLFLYINSNFEIFVLISPFDELYFLRLVLLFFSFILRTFADYSELQKEVTFELVFESLPYKIFEYLKNLP